MKKIRLGSTGLMVTKTSFGALPIQRTDKASAIRILHNAYDGGINYFDTARGYTDSEEKLGEAFSSVRHNIIISTKTHARTKEQMQKDLDLSLKNLKTDYIDIYQMHNAPAVPDPSDKNSVYAGIVEAKKQGKIRHIGITAHRYDVAKDCG